MSSSPRLNGIIEERNEILIFFSNTRRDILQTAAEFQSEAELISRVEYPQRIQN